MAPRASWKGFLKIADVTVPAALYAAASTAERIALHTINRPTGHRVRREYVDAETGKTVERDDQVKGYEVGKGEYVAIEPEEIEAVIPHGDKTLSVSAFVDLAGVDDVYFDKPYYLGPSDRSADEAFAVVREGMRSAKVAAVAQAVLFRRARTVLIRAFDKGLVASTLNYDYEVRSATRAFSGVSGENDLRRDAGSRRPHHQNQNKAHSIRASFRIATRTRWLNWSSSSSKARRSRSARQRAASRRSISYRRCAKAPAASAGRAAKLRRRKRPAGAPRRKQRPPRRGARRADEWRSKPIERSAISPRPPSRRAPRRVADSNIFVVQKHDATRLHYDFRLALDGVLKSWAVTRGPSLNPGEKRLAVAVEDHPVEYADFEGTIAKGEYGGGSVIVWDNGTWAPIGDPHRGLKKGHLEFELDGQKLKGRWHLVRMHGKPRREAGELASDQGR